jgi:uncharacterized membrane protein
MAMSIFQLLSLYGLTLLVMLPLDILWLSTAGARLYKQEIGSLLLEKPALRPAAAFYLLYSLGVVVFAVSPAYRDGPWTTALVYGALFGLLAYATYDLTNLATLRGYTTTIALVDMAWGTLLTAASALLVYLIATFFHII